jgi:hypothetical protein
MKIISLLLKFYKVGFKDAKIKKGDDVIVRTGKDKGKSEE